ncbi:MAG: hypothetical protein IPN95_06380 [Bacteroidetes bacterium]|nr:hypothetical protein [Bacteroidota bacterium]MBL0016611.1 hypothetical protein [Bacteroidota bacterium]
MRYKGGLGPSPFGYYHRNDEALQAFLEGDNPGKAAGETPKVWKDAYALLGVLGLVEVVSVVGDQLGFDRLLTDP